MVDDVGTGVGAGVAVDAEGVVVAVGVVLAQGGHGADGAQQCSAWCWVELARKLLR